MRKKIFLLLILSIMIIIPNYANAAGCANCNGSGGGTGNGSRYQGGSCDIGNCTKSGGGVRLTLYSYEGSGTPKKIGDGVDIWGSGFYTPAKVTSPADSDVLKDRKKGSCNVGHGGYSLSGYPTYTWNQYKQKSTYFIESIYDDISDGSIADWLYDATTGTGWLKTKVFNPMLNGDFASVAKLFNTTESVIKENSENMYIVAELITQIILTPGSSSVYSGTVSEISTNVIFTDYINHMYINNSFYDEIAEATDYTEPFGKLVGKSSSNKYLTAASGNGFYPHLSGNSRFTTGLKGDLCGKPYGLAVWYLAVCCPNCVKSCDTECKDYVKGTTERRACAIEYCKTEDPGNSNCISSCAPDPTGDSGCEGDSCVWTNNFGSNENSDGPECGTDTTLTSRVCYDDKTNITISGESSSDLIREQLDIVYYKIECNEKLKVSNVSKQIKILQFKDRSSDLHLGLTAEFEKTCVLQFKYRKGNSFEWKNANNGDAGSMIKSDMALYNSYYQKYKNTNNELATIYKEAYDDLLRTYNRAYSRLEYVTALDSQSVEAGSKISIVNTELNDSETIEIGLKPIYCEEGKTDVNDRLTTSLKCVLKKEEIYIQDDNSVICGNDGAANVVVNKGTGNASYDYTIHYGTDSSWVSSYDDPNKVYFGDGGRGRADCLTAAEAFNGYCTEIADVYRFEPFDVSIKNTTKATVTSGNYVIKVENYGSCGQIDFRCHSPYLFIDGQACSKCMDYNPTSQEYLDCYRAYCSCDVICGANVACRAKYCPLECEGCEVGYTDITSTDDSCDTCVEKCNTDFSPAGGGGTNKNLSSNIVCRYDCCNASCDIANDTCRFDCCITKCNTLKEKNLLEYMGYETTASMTALEACYQDCRCPNGNCGNDYYYRTINQEKPFPDRTPGANWYNKVEHITESENVNGRYYDPTNGKNSGYEYKISLTSEDIKKIKNDHKINTTYTQKMSSEDKANLDDRGVYCSYLLHDYLNNELNIRIEEGTDGKYGSGCANIG